MTQDHIDRALVLLTKMDIEFSTSPRFGSVHRQLAPLAELFEERDDLFTKAYVEHDADGRYRHYDGQQWMQNSLSVESALRESQAEVARLKAELEKRT